MTDQPAITDVAVKAYGDAGWTALADQAEEAGYDRRHITRHQRGDRSLTYATIGAAYQYGFRTAAKVVDEILAAPTRTEHAPALVYPGECTACRPGTGCNQ